MELSGKEAKLALPPDDRIVEIKKPSDSKSKKFRVRTITKYKRSGKNTNRQAKRLQ